MAKKVIKFSDIEIQKEKFHHIDINKKVVFNKVCFGKKVLNILFAIKRLKLDLYLYFFQKMSAYRRDFNETKYMSFR